GVLRLHASQPQYPGVDHEHAQSHEYEQEQSDVNQRDAALVAESIESAVCHSLRSHNAFACDLPSRRRCDIGTVSGAATTLNITSNVTWPREEPLLQRRQRRYFVWIQRPHQLRRNQHEQLCLLRTV